MNKLITGLAVLCLLVQPLFAQSDRITTLEEKTNTIIEELIALKGQKAAGSGDKMSFHGYGELHYSNTNKDGSNNKMDMHRMVLGWVYRFNDWIRVSAEVDFEHAATEMELEFAQIDFLLSDAFNIRMGSMLMPVGYLNELHEPPRFYSVERPYVQKYIIPTTWQEGGFGLFGSPVDDLNYRLYLVGGLDASGFKASSGIRSGRGKVAEAKGDNLAVVGRVEYSGINGLQLGASGYSGGAAQGNAALGKAGVTLLEGDLRYRWQGVEVTGLASAINFSAADKIASVTGQAIGTNIWGWYLEGAYHLGDLLLPESQDIVCFARLEHFDTQGPGTANNRKVTTTGIAYYPAHQVAVKLDLENWSTGAGSSWQQWNAGMAYEF